MSQLQSSVVVTGKNE